MPKLPDGWYPNQWSALYGRLDERRPVKCDDCGWEGHEPDVRRTLWQINHLAERIDPGCIVPVGTCPNKLTGPLAWDNKVCGALVYYSDVEVAFRPAPTVLDKIVEALDD